MAMFSHRFGERASGERRTWHTDEHAGTRDHQAEVARHAGDKINGGAQQQPPTVVIVFMMRIVLTFIRMTMMIGFTSIALRMQIRLIHIAMTTKHCWRFPLSSSIYFVTRVHALCGFDSPRCV